MRITAIKEKSQKNKIIAEKDQKDKKYLMQKDMKDKVKKDHSRALSPTKMESGVGILSPVIPHTDANSKQQSHIKPLTSLSSIAVTIDSVPDTSHDDVNSGLSGPKKSTLAPPAVPHRSSLSTPSFSSSNPSSTRVLSPSLTLNHRSPSSSPRAQSTIRSPGNQNGNQKISVHPDKPTLIPRHSSPQKNRDIPLSCRSSSPGTALKVERKENITIESKGKTPSKFAVNNRPSQIDVTKKDLIFNKSNTLGSPLHSKNVNININIAQKKEVIAQINNIGDNDNIMKIKDKITRKINDRNNEKGNGMRTNSKIDDKDNNKIINKTNSAPSTPASNIRIRSLSAGKSPKQLFSSVNHRFDAKLDRNSPRNTMERSERHNAVEKIVRITKSEKSETSSRGRIRDTINSQIKEMKEKKERRESKRCEYENVYTDHLFMKGFNPMREKEVENEVDDVVDKNIVKHISYHPDSGNNFNSRNNKNNDNKNSHNENIKKVNNTNNSNGNSTTHNNDVSDSNNDNNNNNNNNVPNQKIMVFSMEPEFTNARSRDSSPYKYSESYQRKILHDDDMTEMEKEIERNLIKERIEKEEERQKDIEKEKEKLKRIKDTNLNTAIVLYYESNDLLKLGRCNGKDGENVRKAIRLWLINLGVTAAENDPLGGRSLSPLKNNIRRSPCNAKDVAREKEKEKEIEKEKEREKEREENYKKIMNINRKHDNNDNDNNYNRINFENYVMSTNNNDDNGNKYNNNANPTNIDNHIDLNNDWSNGVLLSELCAALNPLLKEEYKEVGMYDCRGHLVNFRLVLTGTEVNVKSKAQVCCTCQL